MNMRHYLAKRVILTAYNSSHISHFIVNSAQQAKRYHFGEIEIFPFL